MRLVSLMAGVDKHSSEPLYSIHQGDNAGIMARRLAKEDGILAGISSGEATWAAELKGIKAALGEWEIRITEVEKAFGNGEGI